jgi:type IV secretory pathway protease TraF
MTEGLPKGYPVFMLAASGVVIAYATWNATQSGEISVGRYRVLRSERPRVFKVVVVLRLVVAVLFLATAVALGLGWF